MASLHLFFTGLGVIFLTLRVITWSAADPEPIPFRRVAVIIGGGGVHPGFRDYFRSIYKNTYTSLLERGYSKSDIYFIVAPKEPASDFYEMPDSEAPQNLPNLSALRQIPDLDHQAIRTYRPNVLRDLAAELNKTPLSSLTVLAAGHGTPIPSKEDHLITMESVRGATLTADYLAASEIGEFLNDLPAKVDKTIVVIACYSGLWAEACRAPNTTIITSSRYNESTNRSLAGWDLASQFFFQKTVQDGESSCEPSNRAAFLEARRYPFPSPLGVLQKTVRWFVDVEPCILEHPTYLQCDFEGRPSPLNSEILPLNQVKQFEQLVDQLYFLGDRDNNGVRDSNDFDILFDALHNYRPLSTRERYIFDLNQDGKVNERDLQDILRTRGSRVEKIFVVPEKALAPEIEYIADSRYGSVENAITAYMKEADLYYNSDRHSKKRNDHHTYLQARTWSAASNAREQGLVSEKWFAETFIPWIAGQARK